MKYDRYWDIHISANNGWYDWAPYIRANAAYQSGKVRPGSQPLFLTTSSPVPGPIADVPIPPAGLPDTGVVASVIKVQLLDSRNPVPALKAAELTALVRWIDDRSHVGKLRLNAHGDPGGAGVIFMGDRLQGTAGRQQDAALVGGFVELLRAHGLQTSSRLNLSTYHSWFGKGGTVGRGGLCTINLAICHSSRSGVLGGNATISGVEQIARSLKNDRVYGIEVTGSDVSSQISPSLDAVLVLPAAITTLRNTITPQVAGQSDTVLRTLVRGEWHALTPAEQASIHRAGLTNHITAKINGASRADLISTLTVVRIVQGYNHARFGGAGRWGIIQANGVFQSLAKSNLKVRRFATWTQG